MRARCAPDHFGATLLRVGLNKALERTMQKTRNVIVVIGALAAWAVAMAFVFLGAGEALHTFAATKFVFIGELYRRYVMQFVIHATLGFMIGCIVGVGVVSERPKVWGVATAAAMATLALLNTIDQWFLIIQFQFEVIEVATAIAPAIACLAGFSVAQRMLNRGRTKSAL
jgi:hypothetical protein